jgi:hypothetical protein
VRFAKTKDLQILARFWNKDKMIRDWGRNPAKKR